MESPNVPRALAQCKKLGLKFDIMATTFFLGRRKVVPGPRSLMPMWQDRLFIFLMKNAVNPTAFFPHPPRPGGGAGRPDHGLGRALSRAGQQKFSIIYGVNGGRPRFRAPGQGRAAVAGNARL